MNNKYSKIPCTLHWTIHNVDLKQKQKGNFELEWARGNHKGQTDRLTCDDNFKVNYESNFEIPCTMFVHKDDQSIRKKELKITLKRFQDGKLPKVYGKLTLDLAKYYQQQLEFQAANNGQQPHPIKEDIEMETGRSIAPVMNCSFNIEQVGKIEIGDVDQNDISYAGGTADKMRVGLDEWDVTENEAALNQDNSHHKHSHGKKKDKSKKKSKKNKEKDNTEKPINDNDNDKNTEKEELEDKYLSSSNEKLQAANATTPASESNDKAQPAKDEKGETKSVENEITPAEEKKENETDADKDKNSDSKKEGSEAETDAEKDKKTDKKKDKKKKKGKKKTKTDETKIDENKTEDKTKSDNEETAANEDDDQEKTETKSDEEKKTKKKKSRKSEGGKKKSSKKSKNDEENTSTDEAAAATLAAGSSVAERNIVEIEKEKEEKKELKEENKKDKEEQQLINEEKEEKEQLKKDAEQASKEQAEKEAQEDKIKQEQEENEAKEKQEQEEKAKQEQEKQAAKDEQEKEQKSKQEEEVSADKDKQTQEDPKAESKPEKEQQEKRSLQSSSAQALQTSKSKQQQQEEEDEEEEEEEREESPKKSKKIKKHKQSKESDSNIPLGNASDSNNTSASLTTSNASNESNTSTPPVVLPDSITPNQMIEVITSKSWSISNVDRYINDSDQFPFPACIFPFYATLLETRSLFEYKKEPEKENSTEHNKRLELLDYFIECYEDAPLVERCTPQQSMLTSLLLVLLAESKKGTELVETDSKKRKKMILIDNSKYFTMKMAVFVEKSIDTFLEPILQKFEVMINRFITAKFEMDPLLNDFKHVLRTMTNQLSFSKGINKMLMTLLLSKLEHRMIIKLISNPMRFMFTNAIVWNSFMSALLGDERIDLNILREVVFVLIMANGIADDPSLKNDIAPHIEPKVVLYIMKNYHPDIMLPQPIKVDNFVSHFFSCTKEEAFREIENEKVPDVPCIVTFKDYKDDIKDELNLNSWNKSAIDKSALQTYKWLDDYHE